MKIEDAMLFWSEDTKEVVVASKHENKEHLNGYFFSTGACYREWDALTNKQRMIVFLVNAFKQSRLCSIPIENFKKEFMKIDQMVKYFSNGGWPY